MMKLKNLEFEDKLDWLKITDLDNIFNIYFDNRHNLYKYNLNSTLYFDIDKNILQTYICENTMQWPLISYKLYQTTRLAWFLMKLNNVNAKNLFDLKYAGDKIYYLDTDKLKQIIEDINTITN